MLLRRSEPARFSGLFPSGARRLLFALVLPGFLAAGGAAAGVEIPATLRSEIAREIHLALASDEAASTLPVPELVPGSSGFPESVEFDGQLEEDVWRNASRFRWETIGQSSLAPSVSWTLWSFVAPDALHLAGTSDGDLAPGASLTIHLGPHQQVRLSLDPGQEPGATWIHPGGVEDLTERAGAFAISLDADGVTWELRLDRGLRPLEVPVGPLRPFRLVQSSGTPATILVSPEFRLLPARLNLRMGTLRLDAPRSVEVDFWIENLESRPLNVRTGLAEEEDLPARGSSSFTLRDAVYRRRGAQSWEFQTGSLPVRLGFPSLVTEPAQLRERIEGVLAPIASRLPLLPADRRGSVRDELERIRGILQTSERPSREALESLYLEARALARSSLFARVPPGIRDVLFVRRHSFRSGEFYRVHLDHLPGGGLSRLSLEALDREPETLYSPPAGVSLRDLTLSEDARRVAFTLKDSPRSGRIHELDLTSGEVRARTGPGFLDFDPCYLPDGRLVLNSTRAGTTSPVDDTENFVLHRLDPDTSEPARLSFNNLVDFTPTVLDDGRILFLRWVLEDKPGHFINALWTIYPDGRGISGFFGMNRPGVTIEPHAIPGGREVICVDAGVHGHWRSPMAGDLALVDFARSENRIVDRIEAGRGGFRTPHAIDRDLFLVSHGWSDTLWGLYLLDREGNRELLYRDPEYSSFRPVALRSRNRNRIPRLTAKDPERPARLIVQDVYQGLEGVPRGTVAALRVVATPDLAGLPTRGSLRDRRLANSLGQRFPRVELGTVPVHEDGSVFLEVPPETNLFFQLLDERGDLVQTLRDSLHFAPGEGRSCVGCHESRALAPVGVPRSDLMAMAAPPVPLRPAMEPASPSFPRDIQPLLDRHCLPCHDAPGAAGGVVLAGDRTPYFTVAYEVLVAREGGRQDQIDTLGLAQAGIGNRAAPLEPRSTGSAVSPLLELLDRGHHDVTLEGAERRRLARWIDFNLPFHAPEELSLETTGRDRLSPHTRGLLERVWRRRCRGCHLPPDLDASGALNLDRPALSTWLRAPLSRESGGLGLCRPEVFPDASDRHYRVILEALEQDSREDS